MVNIMDLHFISDPELAPKPRSELKITDLHAAALDSTRYRINITLTPFAPADRPNLDIVLMDTEDYILGSTSIIEAVQRKLSLILHQRTAESNQINKIKVLAQLYFEPEDILHSETIQIDAG